MIIGQGNKKLGKKGRGSQIYPLVLISRTNPSINRVKKKLRNKRIQ